MSEPSIGPKRKRVVSSRTTGKLGALEFEQCLEAAGQVVQRFDVENDFGRDAHVELVRDGEVTGRVVSVQIKSGPSCFHQGEWVLPADEADFTLWRESGVPMFGVVFAPDTKALYWANLSELAARQWRSSDFERANSEEVKRGPYGKPSVVMPPRHRLDRDPDGFLQAAHEACERSRGLPVGALLSGSSDQTASALLDLLALGLHDADAFKLIAATLAHLPAETADLALQVLACATSHPDVFWTKRTSVASGVKTEVRTSIRWSDDDVYLLLSMVGEEAFQRGSLGQSVFHVLELDQDLKARMREFALSPRFKLGLPVGQRERAWAAAIYQYLNGDRARAVLDELLDQAPDLARDDFVAHLKSVVDEYGWADLF